MARFNASNINNYGGSGGSGYFSLKDDGDVATVRFLYNNEEDVEGYAVHQVEVDGRKRYVNCLREYNDPISACPFCQCGEFQMAKLFIPVYNEDTKKVQVWERGKKFFNKISGICARYGSKNDIVSQTFDIQRNGAKGDTLKKKIIDLSQKGFFPKPIDEASDILRLLGNDAAHGDDINYLFSSGFDYSDIRYNFGKIVKLKKTLIIPYNEIIEEGEVKK